MQEGYNTGDDQMQGQSPAKAVPPSIPSKKPALAPKKAGAFKQSGAPAPTTKIPLKETRRSLELDEVDDVTESTDSDNQPLLRSTSQPPAHQRQSAVEAKSSSSPVATASKKPPVEPISLDSPPSVPRKTTWTKSPRGSSDSPAVPRASLAGTRSKVAIPTASGSRTSLQAKSPAKEKVIKVDPVERVAQSYANLEKNLREGLGSQLSIYDKAMGQIQAGIKALKNASSNNEANNNAQIQAINAHIRTLTALIPVRTKKNKVTKKTDTQKTSSDDDHQSSEAKNRSSGDSAIPETVSSGHSSSPDEKSPAVPALSIEKVAVKDEPNSDSPPRAAVQSKPESAQQENLHELQLLPIADFFSTEIALQIIDDSNLSLNSPLLVPLNVIISRLQHLKGQFVQFSVLKDPLSDLCDYYINARQQLIDSKTKQEKVQIFEKKSVAVSDIIGYVELAPGKYGSSAARGRKLVRIKQDGSLDMENKLGRNPGGVDSNAYMKVAKSGEALDPLAEQYAQNTIGLYNQNPEMPTHTASTGIQILRAPLDPIEMPTNPDEDLDPDLKQKLRHYGEHDKAEGYVQCGDLVQGDDFLIILEAQATFVSWTNTLPHDVLQSHFTALQKLLKDDPEKFHDISNWPAELIRNRNFKIDRPEALPTYFKMYLNIVPELTVENALKKIPFLLDNLDSYAFTALFYTQCILDPLDVTAGNLKRCEKNNLRWLRAIDADRCLGPAITLSGGLSYTQIKCFLHVMARELDRKVDPQWVKEFLSLTPLQWLAKNEEQTYQRIHKPNARLLEECILTETVLFDQTKNAQSTPAEPSSSAANPAPRNANAKPKAVGIPFTRTLHRLQLEVGRATRAKNALENNPDMTNEDLFKIVSPEVYILYKRLCLDKIRKGELGNKDNYADSLLKAFDQLLFQTPSYEVVLMDFNETIIPTLIKHGKKGAWGQDYHTAQAYITLVKKINTVETPKEQHLKTMEELTYECMIPELGISLGKLLEDYRATFNEEKVRKLTSPESVKLFYDRQIEPFLPEDDNEILDLLETLGTKFEDIKFELHWLKKRDCNKLLTEAIAQGKHATVKLLSKGLVNINGINADGETGLHTLLRTYLDRSIPQESVLKTLDLCLSISTCEPESEDTQQRTPLMTFIDAMKIQDQVFAEQVITSMRLRNVNLNVRTMFKRNRSQTKDEGTALDFAIDRNNVSAFIALINQGATDFVDLPAALKFIEENKGKKDFGKAVEILKIRQPDLAYELDLNQITTTKPDKDHPEECCMRGVEHGERYFLKEVWDTLINEKGDIIRAQGVKEGKHIVRPIKTRQSPKPLLFAKFKPDMPGLQRFAEIALSLIGCPVTRSELWRYDHLHQKGKTKGTLKEAIPTLLITARNGEPLSAILSDPAKYKEFQEKLDHDQFHLLSTFLMLMGQEDGHQDQFVVVRVPTPEGEKMIVVPIDLDRILVAAYLRNGEEMGLLLKDILMLLKEYRHLPMTPKTIATIMFANGKRFSTQDGSQKELSHDEIEQLIRENYRRYFDKLTSFIPKIEKQQLALFPCDGSIPSCALTGKQAMKYLNSLKEKIKDGLITGLIPPELLQAMTVVDSQDMTLAMKFLTLAGGFITVVGVPTAIDSVSIFYEHSVHAALTLHRLGPMSQITNMKLLSYVRPDLYGHVKGVVTAHPKANALELWPIFTKGYTSTTKGDVVARTSTSLRSYLAIVSAPVSMKRLGQNEFATAREVVLFYENAKQTAALKAVSRREIGKGDTTSLQSCRTLEEFEALANNIAWDAKGKDNRAIISTMITTQRENKFFNRKKVRVVKCKQFTFKDLVQILELSPYLEELDLSGSTLTRDITNVNTNIFTILVECCANTIKKVVLNETVVSSSVVIKGHLLPALTHFEARGCPQLTSLSLINSRLETLDIEGSTNCETLSFEYSAEDALIRPLEEERPLKTFNIRGCTKLRGADITGVLDRSPFLTDFIHGGNQEFNARSFAYFAFQQGRFNRRIFESMIQNGKLKLYGLPFQDKHLTQFQTWLGAANAPKVRAVNDRGCCRTTRLGMVDFVFKQENVERLEYGGPVRPKRTCGGGKEWNMGFKNPISLILTMSNGSIGALSKRIPISARNLGAVEFNTKMPDDSGKDLHSSSYNKEVNAKPATNPTALSDGFDLLSGIEMPDGTLLLSLQEDTAKMSPSSLLTILDPITKVTRSLDIPEVISFGGHLCLLNPTTFALHSDRLYIIQKEKSGWKIKQSILGAHCNFAPISNGKDLMVYSIRESNSTLLCLMNIHTGENLATQRFKNYTVKPVLFLNDDQFIYYDGDFYSVFNYSTLDTIKLQKHQKSSITDPMFAWAIFLPTGELCLGGGKYSEVLDPKTLSRLFTNDYGVGNISAALIAHNGDDFYLNQEGKFHRSANRFFIMDIKFRLQPLPGYECLKAQDQSNAITILTPETIIIGKNHIDESLNNWVEDMLAGKPTCTTFPEMILGLFEKYDVHSKKYGQKPFVTFDDRAILVTGLSDDEVSKLRGLLNIFWKKQANQFAFLANRSERALPQQQSLAELLDEEAQPEAIELN